MQGDDDIIRWKEEQRRKEEEDRKQRAAWQYVAEMQSSVAPPKMKRASTLTEHLSGTGEAVGKLEKQIAMLAQALESLLPPNVESAVPEPDTTGLPNLVGAVAVCNDRLDRVSARLGWILGNLAL